MPVTFSKKVGVLRADVEKLGAFNPVLDLDSRFFIDPHLLKYCKIPEFSESYENFQKHFVNIGKLLQASTKPGDVFWKKADKLMNWREVKGLCIGYSTKGTSGSGIGKELRERLINTAKIIIDKGRSDPELFELVGLFEDDFGPDRISDMTANVIKDDLIKYTQRILVDLKIDVKKHFTINKKTNLPINPFNGNDLILVPSSILRDLPVALDWGSRDIIAADNEALREQVNKTIGSTWRQATYRSKSSLKELLITYPELFDDLIKSYTEKTPQHYNFEEDKSGEYLWAKLTEEIAGELPLKLKLAAAPTIDDVEKLVLQICDQFTQLIEHNGWSKLLYDSNGDVKREEASQLLFFGVCDAYCDANGIMIARESNSGRGPVDFKFGTNNKNSVLVEIKKSTNTNGLLNGVQRQLPTYMKSEKSKRAIYMIIDVGYTKVAEANLNKIKALIKGSAIRLLHIDGAIKSSPSKKK